MLKGAFWVSVVLIVAAAAVKSKCSVLRPWIVGPPPHQPLGPLPPVVTK